MQKSARLLIHHPQKIKNLCFFVFFLISHQFISASPSCSVCLFLLCTSLSMCGLQCCIVTTCVQASGGHDSLLLEGTASPVDG